jgi:hypothetical protein
MTITKQERNYILYAIGFALVWFVLIIPTFQEQISGMSYILQFLIFNLGTLVFFQIFLKLAVLGKKMALKAAIGMTLLFLSLDILQPPFMLNTLGQINANVILGTSSSDYVVAMLGQSIGLQGIILYLFTYILTPLILLILAGMLIKDFVERI